MNQDYAPLDLQRIISTIRRRKKLILTFFLTATIAAVAVNLLLPSVYQSSADLVLELDIDATRSYLFRMNSGWNKQRYNWIQADMALLGGHRVAELAVDSVGPAVIDPTISEEELKDPQERIKLIERVKDKLSLDNPPETNLVRIKFNHHDPVVGERFVGAVIEKYSKLRSQMTSHTNKLGALDNQIRGAEQELRAQEQEMASLKARHQLLSPEDQSKVLLTQLVEYKKHLSRVRARRMGKEAKLKTIEKQVAQGDYLSIPMTEASDSPSRVGFISRLRSQSVDLELERRRLLQKYNPKYKEVVEVEAQIKDIDDQLSLEIQQIVNEEKSNISALMAEEHQIEGAIDDIRSQAGELADYEFQLSKLGRDIADMTDIYSAMIKEREEMRARIARQVQEVAITVVNPPYTSPEPVAPNRMLNVGLTMALSLMLGLGIAFLAEQTNPPTSGLQLSPKSLGGENDHASNASSRSPRRGRLAEPGMMMIETQHDRD